MSGLRFVVLGLVAIGCSRPQPVVATTAGWPTRPSDASTAGDVPAASDDGVAIETMAAPGGTSAILAVAGSLKGLSVVRGDEDGKPFPAPWTIISAIADDNRGASCIATRTQTRCFEFSGYNHEHLVDVFVKANYAEVPPPEWATSILGALSQQPAGNIDIDVELDGAEPILTIDAELGVQYAVKRDGRWRLSDIEDGGKSHRPFYFGVVDLTAAAGFPAIGLVLGGYSKEGCVRSEWDNLVVLRVDGDNLVEVGRIPIGAADWVERDQSHFALFDPKDPNHYALRLAARVRLDGLVQLDVAERHTPRALRKQRNPCGVEIGFDAVDRFATLVGAHRLDDLLRDAAANAEQ